jgi:putative ABC transport system permease protein
MLLTFIKRSFRNQKKSMLLMIASVAVGTAIAASLITVSLAISGKVAMELRAFGANILIEPKVEGLASVSGQARYLRQEDIVKTKTIFWRHNIIGVAPFLEVDGELRVKDGTERVKMVGAWYEKELPLPGETKTFSAGISTVSPWWQIKGEWPSAENNIAIGTSKAARLDVRIGDRLVLDGKSFIVSGIVETGGREDDQVFMELEPMQKFMRMDGRVSRVSVSALTKPLDEFAFRDPENMTQSEYEKWYCTGYVTSIAKQLEEVFQGSRARPVWQVAEAEGRVLERLNLLVYLLSAIVLLASALGVSTTMIISLLRRTEEIGLMKAMGADRSKIVTIFLSEGIIIGILGGLAGYILSLEVVHYIGIKVFSTGFEKRAMLLPVAMGSAVVIAVIGTLLPIRKALKIKPAVVLKGAE